MATNPRLLLLAVLSGALLLATAAPAQEGFFERWQERASETQEAQPHWVTPVVTVTPRLEQELRSDYSRHPAADGNTVTNFGGGKGLELIPSRNTELIIGVPPYLAHHDPAQKDGWGDMSFLLKYRLAAANERSGNYIVTAFLGASIPTGSYRNGAAHALITPTIAAGKGWGNFDVQSTLGVTLPTAGGDRLGHPLLSNTTLQYRVLKKIWPEFEVNATFWGDGVNSGRQQVFLTPGLVLGRFRIRNRLGVTVGGGYQIAATSFHAYDHNWILTARLPF